MSWTDTKSREGLQYGGVDYDEIARKLEATDVGEFEDDDGLYHDPRDSYEGYAREELMDRSSDAPYLESDHQARDPARSRGAINLRYNGNRGFYADLPRHPEMFMGEFGDDPRGLDNQPRFDKIRRFVNAKAGVMQASMGDNSTDVEAERPWSNHAITCAMKELHHRMKRNIKVFTMERLAQRARSHERAWVAQKARRMTNFAPALPESRAANPSRVDAFGDPSAREGTVADGVMSDSGRVGATPTNGLASNPASAKDSQRHVRGEQDYGRETTGRATMAQTIGNLLRYANQGWANSTDDAVKGTSTTNRAPTLQLAEADVARAYRHISEDSSRRPAGTVQDDEFATQGKSAPSGSARLGQDPDPVLDQVQSARVEDAVRMAKSVRESSATDKRRAMGLSAVSISPPAGADRSGQSGKRGSVVANTESPVGRSEVAFFLANSNGMKTKNYAGYIPKLGPAKDVRTPVVYPAHLNDSKQKRGEGKTAFSAWTSHTTTPATHDRDFGANGTIPVSAVFPASKQLRMQNLGESEFASFDGMASDNAVA